MANKQWQWQPKCSVKLAALCTHAYILLISFFCFVLLFLRSPQFAIKNKLKGPISAVQCSGRKISFSYMLFSFSTCSSMCQSQLLFVFVFAVSSPFSCFCIFKRSVCLCAVCLAHNPRMSIWPNRCAMLLGFGSSNVDYKRELVVYFTRTITQFTWTHIWKFWMSIYVFQIKCDVHKICIKVKRSVKWNFSNKPKHQTVAWLHFFLLIYFLLTNICHTQALFPCSFWFRCARESILGKCTPLSLLILLFRKQTSFELRDSDKRKTQENEAMCESKWKIAFTTNYIIWIEMSYCIEHDKIVNIYMH